MVAGALTLGGFSVIRFLLLFIPEFSILKPLLLEPAPIFNLASFCASFEGDVASD